jgi:hypothetical protein
VAQHAPVIYQERNGERGQLLDPAGRRNGHGKLHVASIAAGASQTLTLVVKVGVFGAVSNTASVASATADPNSANNSATATTTVQ